MARRFRMSLSCALWLLIGIAQAQQLNVNLTIDIRSLHDDSELSPKRVDVEVTPPPRAAKKTPGGLQFRGNYPDAAHIPGLSLRIDPPEGFRPYVAALRRRDTEKAQLTRDVRIYLVPNNEPADLDSVDARRQLLEAGQAEKVLPFFQYVFEKAAGPEKNPPYYIKIAFNYARALGYACTRIGYNTCTAARDRFAQLVDMYPANGKAFASVKITLELVRQGLRDLDKFEQDEKTRKIVSQYMGVEDAFGRGGAGYKTAAVTLDGILSDYDQNATIWISNGKPESALRKDAGLSQYQFAMYLKTHPNDPDAPQRASYLERSQANLEKAIDLGDKSDSALQARKLVMVERGGQH